METTMTPEQVQEREALVARYGQAVFDQAVELSGLALCLRSLATDGLSPVQREWLYQQGSLHLAKLLTPLMSAEHSAKVTECSKRIETITETGVMDEIARRAGL
jgi:hypothetical protein